MQRCLTSWSVVFVLAVSALGIRPARAATPTTAPADLYDRIVWQYMQGKWDELLPELISQKKEIAAFTPAQKINIETIRKSVSECRPTWWALSKSGERMRLKPLIWDNTLIATFDPAAKQSIQINYVEGEPVVVVTWDIKDMDNPAEAEHGFTKGELNQLAVWSTLGTARSWTDIPLRSQANLGPEGRLTLNRYLTFRGMVTAAYYTTPRARRWSIWLGMWAYNPELAAKDISIMGRRSIGAMFIAELLMHRSSYPGIKLPELPSDDIEAKLALSMRNVLEHTELTLAEDNAVRAAVKAFAELNEAKVRTTGKVILPNGLPLILDPDGDKPAAAARDAWIKEHYSK